MKKRLKKITIHPFAKQIITRFIGVFFIVCITVAIFLHFTSKPAVAEWFDSNWSFRQRVNIPSHSSLESNVYVTVPSFDATDTSKFQSDCGDLRFTKQNGQLLKYYVVDCDATANIHVFFDSLPAGETNYYMYYGNPSAPNGFESSDFSTAATGLGSLSLASEEAGPGPIAYWAMDEGQGQTVNDGTSNDTSGTLGTDSGSASDDPTWQTEDQCISGKCLQFDGSDDFVNIDNESAFDFTDTFTFSAWVKPMPTQNIYANILRKESSGGGFGIEMDSNANSNTYFAGWKRSGGNECYGSNSFSLTPNRWQHLSMVKSGTSRYIYIDGNLVSTCTGSVATIVTNNDDVKLASWGGVGTRNWNGYMDNVKFYSYARTAAQVKTDYIKGASTTGSAAVAGKQDTAFLNNGLVGYWKMDESSWTNDCSTDTVLDSSGNGNNGDACPNSTGPVGGATGKFGNAGLFDGSNDYVNIPDDTSLHLSDFTIATWINPSSTAASAGLVSKRSSFGTMDWELFHNASGRIMFIVGESGARTVFATVTNPVLATNTWTHVVIIKEGTTYKAYYNGVLQRTETTDTTWTDSDDIVIGAAASSTSPYSGTIDETRIYNRPLTDAEVSDLYNWAPGPVGYWNFNENTETTAYDLSGNENHATMVGSLSYTPGKYGSAILTNRNDQIDYYNVGDPASGILDFNDNQSFTYAAWVRKDGDQTPAAGDVVWFRKGANNDTTAGYDIQMDNTTGAVSCRYADGDGSGVDISSYALTPNIGEWYHVTCVMDRMNSNFKIFINGTLRNTNASLTEGSGVTTTGLSFGDFPPNATYEFFGAIDEAKIYNYARSPSQIIEDMNGGHPIGGSPISSKLIDFKFNEQQGQVINNIGFGGISYNGTLGASSSQASDDPLWNTGADCKDNGCLEFDGSNDYIALPDNSVDSHSVGSICTWAYYDKSSDDGTQGALFTVSDNASINYKHSFYISDSGSDVAKVRAVLRVNTSSNQIDYVTADNIITRQTWNHYCFTQAGDGTGVKLYVNAKPIDFPSSISGTVTVDDWFDDIAATAEEVTIGNIQDNSADSFFTGRIDNFHLYNVALTADQVKTEYNAGASLNFGTGASAESTLLIDGSGNPPVGYWNMDENTGTTAYDKSGNEKNGTITGATWQRGKLGGSLSFDNNGDYVDIGNQSTYDIADGQDFSIEAWVNRNPNDLSTNDVIFAKTTGGSATGYIFRIDDNSANNDIRFAVSDGTDTYIVQTATEITNSGWYHLVAVFDDDSDSGTRIYVNGNSDEDSTIGTLNLIGSLSNAESVRIGSESDSDAPFNGQLDNVKFYNYALTPAQVAYAYNRGAPIAHWKMNECQGTTVYDNSGNSINGTWSGTGSGTQTAVGTCATSSTAWGNGATGKYGASLNFDGTDDYISIPDSSLLTSATDQTVSLWFKTSANYSGGIGILYSNYGSVANNYIRVYMNTSNGVTCESRSPTHTGTHSVNSPPVNDGNWHHVTCKRTLVGTTWIVYISFDGIAQAGGGGVGSTAINTSGVNKTIGTLASSPGTLNFTGQIDDVRLFNYALSPTQIKILHNEGASIRFGPDN